MSMCLRSSNSLHSILASVLSKTIKHYCLKFHAPGQHWTCPMQTRWQRSYNVLYARIARARLESITQSACVAYSLLPAKPWWWQVSLDDRDSSEIFKPEKFRMCCWPRGLAKCNESKHDEDAFHLAVADLNSYDPKSLWQTSHFKK